MWSELNKLEHEIKELNLHLRVLVCEKFWKSLIITYFIACVFVFLF
jgi:hypothetical protein